MGRGREVEVLVAGCGPVWKEEYGFRLLGRRVALQFVSRCRPIGDAALVTPDVGVPRLDQPAVRKLTGDTCRVGAVHHYLIIEVETLSRFLNSVEMHRSRNVGDTETPFVHGHEQLEVVTAIEFGFEFLSLDGLDFIVHEVSV